MAEKNTVGLHGRPVDHISLRDEGYESPEAFSEQGDTRVVRDLMFGYTVATQDAAGNDIINATEAHRGDTVTTEQIGLLNLRKGEENHSFYTTVELDRLRNPLTGELAPAGEPVGTATALSEAGEYELAEWLTTADAETGKEPTINEVLERVGEDKELAHRMLQAENIATNGEPRKGLETGLSRIIQGA